jgi:hypothetical protein
LEGTSSPFSIYRLTESFPLVLLPRPFAFTYLSFASAILFAPPLPHCLPNPILCFSPSTSGLALHIMASFPPSSSPFMCPPVSSPVSFHFFLDLKLLPRPLSRQTSLYPPRHLSLPLSLSPFLTFSLCIFGSVSRSLGRLARLTESFKASRETVIMCRIKQRRRREKRQVR